MANLYYLPYENRGDEDLFMKKIMFKDLPELNAEGKLF